MLTLNNVRAFRAQLKDLEFLCDDLLKARERQRIFRNEEELSEALTAARVVPHEYYKFQLFSFYIELCKDRKGYYIYSENFTPKTSELRRLSVSGSQYRIPTNDFEEVKKYFELFCIDMIHVYYNDSEQLIYMY